ncbi:MAG: lipid-A-disaccharide synthase [Proteobacteria bacterium]|nr:lipid-A-disaccharide synthase [Pseudomonadota bacterium]
MNPDSPFVFLIAGEPSGDSLGSRLMAALQHQTGGKVRFAGVGGPLMEAKGLESLFPMAELSVMGLGEILPHLPRLLRRMRQTAAAVDHANPDAIITIDSPGFANGVVRRLKNRTATRIHYVAPSVWAWRPWRVHKYKKNFDHLLALLPFEPPYFEAVGLPCHYVGHPVIEYGADKGDGPGFRRKHGIATDATVICVLPGSRAGEVRRLAPVFGAALTLLAARGHDFRVFIPTVSTVANMLPDYIADWPGTPSILTEQTEKYDLMAASNAALAASGTVALELALARVPSVIGYKVAWATAKIVRCMIHVQYANLINIILDKRAVPEWLQHQCTAEALSNDLALLLKDKGKAQIEAVAPALDLLGEGDGPPSTRAAQTILKILQQRTA